MWTDKLLNAEAQEIQMFFADVDIVHFVKLMDDTFQRHLSSSFLPQTTFPTKTNNTLRQNKHLANENCGELANTKEHESDP